VAALTRRDRFEYFKLAMTGIKQLKGACDRCQAPLEFPADSIGLTARCPHCGEQTELLLAPPPVDDSVARKVIAWTAAGVLAIAVGVAAPLIGLKFFEKKLAQRRASQAAPAIPAGEPTNSHPLAK
jgi:DNA-directed RNA polymerase subunit RPC12/RpoP